MRSRFAGVVRAVLAHVGAATISERGLLGQLLIKRNPQGAFDQIRGFGSPPAHGGNQTRVADCFGNEGRVLAFLGETACGTNRFTSLAHEETIGEIVGVGQPTTGGLRGRERLF
jgi:hypothetical protein